MKTKFMSAVAIVALATATGAVSAEAKTKKVKTVKAPAAVAVVPAGPVLKGPAPAACDRINNFVATGDSWAFLTDKCDITWNGLTFFGALDFGAGWMSHATELEKTMPQGQAYLGSANNQRYGGFRWMPGGLGYNQVGIKGAWKVFEGTSLIVNATTNFDPYTMSLLDGPRSLQRAWGKAAASYEYFNGDSSRAGQAFNNELYGGLKHDVLGQLTYGRHTSMIAETNGAFDPLNSAVAFSLLGYNGGLSSGGSTETGKLDNSLKYKGSYGPVYGGGMVTLGNSQGVAAEGISYGFNGGIKYAGLDLGAAYQHTTDAINMGVGSNAAHKDWLSATLSDNDAFSVAAKYNWQQWTGFLGYSYIDQNNATDRKAYDAAGNTSYYNGNGYRYYFTSVTNASNPFPATRHFDVVWTGVNYAYNDKLTLTGAWYHANQARYGATAAQAAGRYDVISLLAQYKLNARMQVYVGNAYSAAVGGFSSTWTNNSKVNWNPMAGFRMTF